MPKAQRSRACQQCRERRVKCDETPEICQQCRRLGLRCSGPIQGSVIIDMTDRVAKPRKRKKRDPSTAAAVPQIKKEIVEEPAVAAAAGVADLVIRQPSSSPHGVPDHPAPLSLVPQRWKRPDGQWNESEAEEAIQTIRRHQKKIPTLYSPTRMVPEALDTAFITHFVQLNHGARPYSPEIPWITHLPRLRQSAIKPALRLSIRAASMACYATVHQDPAILVDSYRWYTLSLHCQRQSLSRLAANAIPSEEEILVPIILSLYEVFAGTTTTSIWQHLLGATHIIALRGPHNCRGGTFPMFKAMRVSDAHLSMVFNRPSVFSSPDWMTIPFEFEIKNAHMLLADILIQIPGCISLCNANRGGNMRSFFASSLPANIDLQPAANRARQLIRDLDAWTVQFPHLLHATGADQVVTTDMHRLALSGSRSMTPDEPTITLPDSFVALTAATYQANRLILSLLLDKLTASSSSAATRTTATNPSSSSSPSPSSWHSPTTPPSSSPSSSSGTPPNLMATAIASSQAILDISAHIESRRPVGFEFMRSVFPLVVVASVGPRIEEESVARDMLDRWGQKKGMAGLCKAWLQDSY